jgi:hypothetical protein
LIFQGKVSFWVGALPVIVFSGSYALLCGYSVWKLGIALSDVGYLEGEERKLYTIQGIVIL